MLVLRNFGLCYLSKAFKEVYNPLNEVIGNFQKILYAIFRHDLTFMQQN